MGHEICMQTAFIKPSPNWNERAFERAHKVIFHFVLTGYNLSSF